MAKIPACNTRIPSNPNRVSRLHFLHLEDRERSFELWNLQFQTSIDLLRPRTLTLDPHSRLASSRLGSARAGTGQYTQISLVETREERTTLSVNLKQKLRTSGGFICQLPFASASWFWRGWFREELHLRITANEFQCYLHFSLILQFPYSILLQIIQSE